MKGEENIFEQNSKSDKKIIFSRFSINPAANFQVKVNNASVIGASNFNIEKLR